MFQVNGLLRGGPNGRDPLAAGWLTAAGLAPGGWAMQDTP